MGLIGDGPLGVAVSQVTASSELKGAGASGYVLEFGRFCQRNVLGLGHVVALDLLRSDRRLTVNLLVASDEGGVSAGTEQLERLRRKVSRAFGLEALDPEAYLTGVAGLDIRVVVEAGTAKVGFSEVNASAVLPLELAPSGIGVIAELLDTRGGPDCLVRMILAPRRKDELDFSLVMEQLSAAESIITDRVVPDAVSFRATAVRNALRGMLNTWLGQPYAVEIQIHATSEKAVEAIWPALRSELARPKGEEIQRALGRETIHYNQSQTLPELAVLPVKRSPRVPLVPAPFPSFWLDGQGERPKHLAPQQTAFLLTMPPLPQYCDLASVADDVVEDRVAKRPELWRGAGGIARDSAGSPIGLDAPALARHVHVLGVPGSGKTTLLHKMINEERASGTGFLVLDPHGDLAKRLDPDGYDGQGIVSSIPFPGLRILSSASQGLELVERDVGVIIETIEAVLPALYTGPRFRKYTRMCLTMHACVGQGRPVEEAFDYILDEEKYNRALSGFVGPSWVEQDLRTFWQISAGERAEVADWAASRVTDYLRTGVAMRFFAPVGEGLTGGGLVRSDAQIIVDLVDAGASVQDTKMIGQLFVTTVLRDVMTGGPVLDRRFMIYLDEVHLFAGESVDRALQEGRKYGISVVAAHQASSQLSHERFDALISQVGLELIFRSSLRDSELLSGQLEVNPKSISKLADFEFWVAGGITTQRGGPFLARLEVPW
jgi:hypothetical protein